MYHIPLCTCEVLAIFEINAKEVYQVDMKWKSTKEFGTEIPEMNFFPFALPNTIDRRNYKA